MTTPDSNTETSLSELLQRLQTEGVAVDVLEDWREKGVAAFLFGTDSGAGYLVEVVDVEKPCLVSRLAELGPGTDYDGPRSAEVIYRRQGNPDSTLKVGEIALFLGIARRGTEFDRDSIYQTSSITSITYLPRA